MKDSIKEIVKKLMPDCLLERIRFIRVSKCIKRTKKWKLKKQKAYIFQIPPLGNGLLCVYRRGLSEILKFKEKGCLVAVNYENVMGLENRKLGEGNLWDAIFEQPCGISVAEAMKKDTVILVNQFTYFKNYLKLGKNYDPSYYKWMNELYGKVFPIKENLKDTWDTDFSSMFSGKRVLGVTLRETFRLMHENNSGWSARHPNEPDTKEIIDVIKEKLEEYHCDYIFVATEFVESIETLSGMFGDKLLYTDRFRKHITREYIEDIVHAQSKNCSEEEISAVLKRDADGDRVRKSREYVKEMYGLSKCTCLLGTPSSGMLIALLWNGGKYENISFFGEKSFESTSYFCS